MSSPLVPPRPSPAVVGRGDRPSPDVAGRGLVLEPGALIAGKYVLERPAGFGGMAQLWVARNQATGAEVCVKILVPEEGEEGRESVARFRREAHASAKLNHRAIVGVFDLLELDANGQDATGRAPHGYAMVMELLRGETLGDCLAKREKLPLNDALDLFLPVVSALAHAHRADVVHRDLKPDNIFLATDPDGHVAPKVLDFGVSKLSSAESLTTDGVIVGTPSFMSPEQASGARDIDARSDVFSAGLLLYVMLTGRNPFEDDAFASVVDAIVRREVPPIPELPPAIWGVLQKALEKDPSRRFPDATEMGIELRKAAGRKATTESNPMLPIASPPASTPSFGGTAVSASVPRPELAETGAPLPRKQRARAIVAGVVGASAALLVTALAVTYARPRGEAKLPETAAASPSLEEAEATPAAEPQPTPQPAALDAATSRPAPSASSAPIVSAAPPLAATSPRAAMPVSANPTAPPRRTPIRKPGEEPHKARDPGF